MEGKGHQYTFVQYVLVWVALIVLTGITVMVSFINLGVLNIVVAIFIATIKASLVSLFFMHLKFETDRTWAYIGLALFALLLFIGLTALDSLIRGV